MAYYKKAYFSKGNYPRSRKIKREEKLTESSILEYLNYYPNSFAYKVNNVGTYSQDRRAYLMPRHRFAIKGPSDILFFVQGKGIAIEVKTEREFKYIMKHYEELRFGAHSCPKKTRYQNQIHYIENIKESGNIGFFTYSLEHTLQELKAAGILPIPDDERCRFFNGQADRGTWA